MSLAANLTALVRNWTGAAPPPVVARPAASRWGGARALPSEVELRVVEVVSETPTVMKASAASTGRASVAVPIRAAMSARLSVPVMR